MKKCPQCGAIMDKDVNFCTSCGYDLRNISVQKEETVSTTEVKNSPKIEAEQTKSELPVGNNTNNSKGQYLSYWQWCIDSWRNPGTSSVNVANWYGWLTILIKDALIVLGLYFCA